MTTPVPSPPSSLGESWLIPRDHRLLMELPVALRWEVTRRHPYYLQFWELAHRHHHSPSSDRDQCNLETSATLILQAIGVSGDPPPPNATAEALGATSLSQGWGSGAVAPVTFRGLVQMLLLGLPRETCAAVGQFLSASATPSELTPEVKYQALFKLSQLRDPALDGVPNRPVIGVNVQAPQRVILDAVEQLVRQWKQEGNISEKRRRDDKLDDYLTVWDLREGWAGDHYDGSREQTLRQIAREQGIPLSTAANRYRSAFRLITGRDYAPDLWARLLGLLKLTEWADPVALPKLAARRPWRQQQPREISETVLQPAVAAEVGTSVLNTIGISPAEVGAVDLLLDIQHLLAQGRSNEEIATALELPYPEAGELIESYRERLDDHL